MLRILIVDDEVKIRQMIAEIIHSYCRGVEIIAHAEGVSQAERMILDLSPDLVLLDIKMDDGTGFDLLSRLNKIDFRVVFITAYSEFALKAIKFSALDYILKPIDPKELIDAINNAAHLLVEDQHRQIQHLSGNLANNNGQTAKKVLLKTAESLHIIKLSDIYYCEAHGGYTLFYTGVDQHILVSKPLGEYEELFIEYGFFRVHKSYMVNLQKVERFIKEEGGALLMGEGIRVPVASRKKDQLITLLEKLTE